MLSCIQYVRGILNGLGKAVLKREDWWTIHTEKQEREETPKESKGCRGERDKNKGVDDKRPKG